MKRSSYLLVVVGFLLGGIVTSLILVTSLRTRGTLTIHPALHRIDIKGDLAAFQTEIGLEAGSQSVVILRNADPKVSIVQKGCTLPLDLCSDDRLICTLGFVPIDCYYRVPALHDTFCDLLLEQVASSNRPSVGVYRVRIPQGVIVAPRVTVVHPSHPLK